MTSAKPKRKQVCATCSNAFSTNSPTARFCSDRCRWDHWKKRLLTCPHCGGKFSRYEAAQGAGHELGPKAQKVVF